MGNFIECNRDCEKCKHLNAKTDNKGYPFGYECMKYWDSVFRSQFKSTKIFMDGGNCDGMD